MLLRIVEKRAILVAVFIDTMCMCRFVDFLIAVYLLLSLIVCENGEMANEMEMPTKYLYNTIHQTHWFFAEMRCHKDFAMINYNKFHINRKTGNLFILYIQHYNYSMLFYSIL